MLFGRGHLPASTFQGDFMKTYRGYLPDERVRRIQERSGQSRDGSGQGPSTLAFPSSVSTPAVAYQVRGLFVTFFKAFTSPTATYPPSAAALKSFQFAVNDRALCAGQAADEHLPGLLQGGDARPGSATPAIPAEKPAQQQACAN